MPKIFTGCRVVLRRLHRRSWVKLHEGLEYVQVMGLSTTLSIGLPDRGRKAASVNGEFRRLIPARLGESMIRSPVPM
jgi:hypothetical protein